MVTITLVSKSRSDKKPTINTSELINLGLIPKRVTVKNGDVFLLKLSPIGGMPGIIADQEFQASRDGSTLMAKDGWNEYLFGLPSVGKENSIKVNCAGILFPKTPKQVKTEAPVERVTYDTPSKSELKRILIQLEGNKTACARALGVSPRTFGRFLERRGL